MSICRSSLNGSETCHSQLLSMMSVIQLSVLGSIFVLSILTFFFYRHSRAGKPRTLPSPRKLPFIGNLHQLGPLLHHSLHALSQKHGPLMLLHLGRVPTLIVSSAEAAHEVMTVHDLAFASRPPSSIAKRLLYDSHDVAFSPYGEYWRQVRRVCVLHLLNVKRVQSFSNVRREEISLMVERIQAGPQPVNLGEMILALSNDIICRAAFGRKYSCSSSGGGALAVLSEYVALLGTFAVGDHIPWLWWIDRVSGLDKRVEKTFHQLDAFLEEVIEDHVRNRERLMVGHEETMDFVDVLLSLDVKDGISLTRDNIKAIILDMYAGGTDTSYSTLEWTMAELMRHPEAMKRAQDEVRGIVGLKQNIEDGDLDQMNYMKSVIKESLRLHPPVPLLVPRESMEDTHLMGHYIPSRTRVIVNAWSIGRDPKSWDRAEEFWPDRFIDCSIDFRGKHFQFVPFGAGRRGCPGLGFAVPTLELALANLLFHFDWAMTDAKGGENLDMSEISAITSHMKHSLILEAKSLF